MSLHEEDSTKREAGLFARRNCPDCKGLLLTLCKILDHGHTSLPLAKLCINKNCWRFVQIANLMSWKKYRSYPLPKLDKFNLLD
jgi:hypothetical protein